jgi:hypothetical protein
MATKRPTIDSQGYKSREGLIINAVWSWWSVKGGRPSSLEYELITSSSSRKILRSSLRQLGADEEPEKVAGSCDVIESDISDCKLRLM